MKLQTWLLCCILLCSKVASATDIAETRVLTLADSLFAAGEYAGAEQEYLRAGYFSTQKPIRRYCVAQRAECLLRRNEPLAALDLLSNHVFVADSTGRNMAITRLRCLMVTRQWETAILSAWNFETIDPENARRYQLYRCLALFENRQTDESVSLASSMLSENGKTALKLAYKQYRKKRRSPVLASLLSIVPGLGQLYAGDYRNFANSLLLNAAIAGLVVYELPRDRVLGIFLGTGFGTRYYLGGISNAGKSAVFHNNRQKEVLKAIMLSLLYAERKG